ncbi:alpha/beta fold hydrolase [Pseudooceanicola sp.]|uniref:alpha/beta fold hydrolase n=1 Tax=Pseudooceanicola sp. TaxID=1914328 RepID=UPI002630FBF6|nr:alpha/beta fold hydrolase [Pseudooceanicola sp.]MDF1855952.1 alpha/beta fold hydrolase [Pseudooceanicola sp.]
MTQILLIHGACHGSWCWRDVIPALEARGHEVQALDMPGRAGDTRDPAGLTLADQAQTILDVARDGAVLVGHSAGGFSIAAAAEAAPDKVQHLVFVAALLPQDGAALGKTMAGFARDTPPAKMVVSPDRASFSFDPVSAAPLLYNGVSPEDAAWAAAQICYEPSAPHREAIHLGAGFAGVPKSFIRCTEDLMIPPEDQARMARAAGAALIDMATGHSPFLSQPEELAEHIHRIATPR